MAYDVFAHMQARVGDALPTDVESGNTGIVDPGMSVVLSSDGGNVTWLVGSGGPFNCNIAMTGTVNSSPTTAGSGLTLIFRGRFVSQIADGTYYQTLTASSTSPHIFQRVSSNDQAFYPFSPFTNFPIDFTTAERTVVARYEMAKGGANTVGISIWVDGGVGDTPDFPSGQHSTSENGNVDAFRMKARPGMSYHARNLLVLDGEVTDAEGRALANDLDAELGLDGITLSNPTATVTGDTTADGGVDSSAPSDGTIDIIASISTSEPSEAQLKAGQESTGATADWSVLAQAMTANPQAWSATGLTPGQQYRFFSGQTDGGAAFSNIAASALFTPAVPPVLSNPTGTATGQSTADGGVDTDTLSDGTYDVIASTSATPPNETELKAGQESGGGTAPWSALAQAVTGANPQAWSATGLAADTDYYFHSGQTTALGTFSNIATSAQFTTDAALVVKIVFLEPLKQYDGLLWASLGSLSVRVYNDNMTALIWQTDAGITDANGILAEITDPALVDATFYRVVVFDATRASRPYRIQALNQ